MMKQDDKTGQVMLEDFHVADRIRERAWIVEAPGGARLVMAAPAGTTVEFLTQMMVLHDGRSSKHRTTRVFRPSELRLVAFTLPKSVHAAIMKESGDPGPKLLAAAIEAMGEGPEGCVRGTMAEFEQAMNAAAILTGQTLHCSTAIGPDGEAKQHLNPQMAKDIIEWFTPFGSYVEIGNGKPVNPSRRIPKTLVFRANREASAHERLEAAESMAAFYAHAAADLALSAREVEQRLAQPNQKS